MKINGSRNANLTPNLLCYNDFRKQDRRRLYERGKSFYELIKNTKVELIVAGVTLVGAVLIYKNWNSLKGVLTTKAVNAVEFPKSSEIVEKSAAKVLPDGILDNLTGNKLTARALGDKVWCSAQAINKRIVAAGLAERLPCGEYMMTETGKLLGHDTWKTTASGHSFTNIEWDERILDVILHLRNLRILLKCRNEQSRFLHHNTRRNFYEH